MKNIFKLLPVLVAASALTAQAQYYVNDFNNLTWPGGNALWNNGKPFAGSGMSYQIFTDDDHTFGSWSSIPSGQFYSFEQPGKSGDWAVGVVDCLQSFKVKMTSANVVGFGGDFFFTDDNGNDLKLPPGSLGANVLLSDNSVVPFPLTPGFGIYNAPAGLTIQGFCAYQINNPQAYLSMDNLITGMQTVVPEPAVIATNALMLIGALGGAWMYRRRKA